MGLQDSQQFKMISGLMSIMFVIIIFIVGINIVMSLLGKAATYDIHGWVLSTNSANLLSFGDTTINLFGGVSAGFGENPQNFSILPGNYCEIHIVGSILKNSTCDNRPMPSVLVP